MAFDSLENCISGLLEKIYNCKFEVVRGFRDVTFISADYDFTFQVSTINSVRNQQEIEKEVRFWLERDADMINSGCHIIYGGSGIIQPQSVLRRPVNTQETYVTRVKCNLLVTASFNLPTFCRHI